MPARRAPQTWRLLELFQTTGLPCANCGEVHRFLMRMAPVGDCLPVLFPPGVPAPDRVGVEVELHLAGPTDDGASPGERSRFQQVAERVRQTSIRCEGCGERFTDLEEYHVHACEVRYR